MWVDVFDLRTGNGYTKVSQLVTMINWIKLQMCKTFTVGEKTMAKEASLFFLYKI